MCKFNGSFREISSLAYLSHDIYGDHFKFGFGPIGRNLEGKIFDGPNQTIDGFRRAISPIVFIILFIFAAVFSLVAYLMNGWVPISISGFIVSGVLIVSLFFNWLSINTLESVLTKIVKRVENPDRK